MQLWAAKCKSSKTRGNTSIEEKGRLGGAVIKKKSFGGNWEFEVWWRFLSCIVARQGGGGSSFCRWGGREWCFFLWGHTVLLFLLGWDLHWCLELCVRERPAVAPQPHCLGFPCVFSQWKLSSLSSISLISMKVWHSSLSGLGLIIHTVPMHWVVSSRAVPSNVLYVLLPRQVLEPQPQASIPRRQMGSSLDWETGVQTRFVCSVLMSWSSVRF